MKLTLGQAAKEAGVSKATISRALKNGKISADREGNQYRIDPAELFRVFPKKVDETFEVNDAQPPNETERNEIKELREKLHATEVELARAEASADAKADHIASLEKQLDVVNRQLPAPSQQERKGFFGRLFS